VSARSKYGGSFDNTYVRPRDFVAFAILRGAILTRAAEQEARRQVA